MGRLDDPEAEANRLTIKAAFKTLLGEIAVLVPHKTEYRANVRSPR